MLRQLYSVWIFLAFLLGSSAIARGQDADTTLALTFAYSPKGSTTDLASGYKKHLEWHTAKNDPILWYAWFVVEGDRLGHFIDGAYDVTGAEFDSRPDPTGDAEDATKNFLPVAQMQYRRIFRLRKDLGTSSFLEDRHPSSLMQVVYYHVSPGKQIEFETAVSAIGLLRIMPIWQANSNSPGSGGTNSAAPLPTGLRTAKELESRFCAAARRRSLDISWGGTQAHG